MTFVTTTAMVEAAQDAYDVAAADAAVAKAKAVASTTEFDPMATDKALAKLQVALAAQQYAWAVLVSTRSELQVSA